MQPCCRKVFNQVVNMRRRAATQQKCLLVYRVIYLTSLLYINIYLTVRADAWRPGQLVGVSSSQIGALLWNQTERREHRRPTPPTLRSQHTLGTLTCSVHDPRQNPRHPTPPSSSTGQHTYGIFVNVSRRSTDDWPDHGDLKGS